jgi:hypothetical protein
MNVAELIPILQNLSPDEKLSLLEFLQTDLNQSKNYSESPDAIFPRLHRKEGILVIETAPLNHIDFNEFIERAQITQVPQ